MDLAAENKRLREEIVQLRQRIKEMEALLKQNSRNSNWPSSRDKSRKRPKPKSLRRKTGRKVGGQEGHKGHTLKFNPEPDGIATHR